MGQLVSWTKRATMRICFNHQRVTCFATNEMKSHFRKLTGNQIICQELKPPCGGFNKQKFCLYSVLLIRTHRVDPWGPTNVLICKVDLRIQHCLHPCLRACGLLHCLCWYVAAFLWSITGNCVHVCPQQNRDLLIKTLLHRAISGQNLHSYLCARCQVRNLGGQKTTRKHLSNCFQEFGMRDCESIFL